VSYYPERGFFVAPKLPGLKTFDVKSIPEGQQAAEAMWRNYLGVLNG